jgi:peptide/nickel transport system ATP-binding protein
MTGANPPVLEVRDLVVELKSGLRPVDGVSFQLRRGGVLGLVGESGSGKSLTGLAVMGLVAPPLRIAGGRILLDGSDLRHLAEHELRQIRGSRVAMIFQDPMATLSPTLRIATQMIDAIQAHERIGRAEAWRRCRDAIGRLGVPSPDERMQAYPHELSGGLRQRVVIATAMLNRPALVIADEPTTALDVTIQAQILHEVQKLCAADGTALIWISHDLSVVACLADRIAVMYAGAIVEDGPTDQVLDRPTHPYTEGLIRSVPQRDRPGTPFRQIPGMPPPLAARPDGCRVRPRCTRTSEACRLPPSATTVAPAHSASCHHPLGAGAP